MDQSNLAQLPSFCDEEVFVLGLRRSGIHGVLSWLIPHFDGMSRLINDHDFRFGSSVSPIHSDDPVLYYQSRGGQAVEVGFNVDFGPMLEEHIRATSEQFLAATPGWLRPIARSIVRKYKRSRAELPRRYRQIPYDPSDLRKIAHRNIYVFENMSPVEFAGTFRRWRQEVYLPWLETAGFSAPSRVRVVQIIREPWNQMASLLKNAPTRPPRVVGPAEFRDLWVDYARENVGETSHLRGVGPVLHVNFPRWFSEPSYRVELAGAMDLPPTDAGLEIVPDFGGGSSFDAQSKHGKAQDMKVRERWRAFTSAPEMRRLCSDGEVRELSRRVFGADTPEETRS